MSDLVQLQLGKIFRTFKRDVEGLRDGILQDARPIIRREWARKVSSGSTRFYRTGAGLQSAIDEFATEGQKRIYRLFPTAFYMIFGEYGTGRRGAATGRPAPRGYRYGSKPGMAARRFARTAVSEAKPQILKLSRERIQRYALNMTTN